MTHVRSEGWVLHPSFVPMGPTAPITLVFDESGLTQYAGVYPVTWQTPWSELTNLELRRVRRGMSLYASVHGVRHCWRTRVLDDYEDVRAVVLSHGGAATRRIRHTGVYAVVTVMLLASLAVGIGTLVTSTSSKTSELEDARGVNLTLKDVSDQWAVVATSYLQYLFPPSTQVITSTPTTAPARNSAWRQVSTQFQRCIGLSNAKDRMYGAAGQMPDYQVSSPIFSSPLYGGIEVASTTQYYATTTMVNKDVAEMTKKNFGNCFVASNASLILAGTGGAAPKVASASSWRPHTFVHGWARGGVVELSLPNITGPVHLVIVETAFAHYEVTLGALVASWPQSQHLVASLVNTLKARMMSTSAAAV